MSHGLSLDQESRESVLQWAVKRQAAITMSLLSDGRWRCLRSQLLGVEPERQLLQLSYPIAAGGGPPPEITPGDQVGLSFRRGHKKCIFVSPVVARRLEAGDGGDAIDTLLVRVPDQIRELQRRAYQRATVPPDRFIAVKLWQGGVPAVDGSSWPVCSGRVNNISAGGIMVDVRSDQNPRFGVGDMVGLEITAIQGRPPLMVEGQYRHCTAMGTDRIGLGLQFLGLEHDNPGQASLSEVADLVRELQQQSSRQNRQPRRQW